MSAQKTQRSRKETKKPKRRKELTYSLDLDFGVEVRDPALRIGNASFDQYVAFRPMNLDVAWRDRRNKATPSHLPDSACQQDGVAVSQTNSRGILLAHQHVLATGSGQGVQVSVDHAVELFAAPRGEP